MREFLSIVVALGLASALAGCSDGASKSTSGASTRPGHSQSRRPAQRSAGCGAPRHSESTNLALNSSGRRRTFRVALPPGYSGTDPAPLIIEWHGYGWTMDDFAALTGLERRAGRAGYVVITPQAVGDPPMWNMTGRASLVDDARFAEDLIDWATSGLCIDTNRVYSTGMSNGAGMSAYLACAIPARIAAVSVVAGLNLARACLGKTMSVLAFHSVDDPLVPYAGGRIRMDRDLHFQGVETTLTAWAERDECDAERLREELNDRAERVSYANCAAGTEVVLYARHAGGHGWPGFSAATRVASDSDGVDATALTIEFFDAH